MSRCFKPSRIGIFGGSFSPLHWGHLRLARSAQRALGLDLLYFVPCGKSADGKRLLPALERARTLRQALRREPKFGLSMLELRRRAVSRTVDTLRAFRQRFPQARLFLLMGADQARRFSGWKAPEQIAKLAEIWVAPRRGSRIPTDLRRCYHMRLLRIPYFDVSSTKLR